MREQVETQRQHLVTTLQRMQRRLKEGGNREADKIYAEEYAKEVQKYDNMLRGGDGGPFRDSEFTIRELHFKNWRDSDFQLLLEAIGEVPVIDDEEWELRFGSERSFFGKLFGKGGRPK